MSSHAEGTAYLTVRKDWRNGNRVQAAKVTNKPPTVTDVGDVVVKVRLKVPHAAFRPLDAGLIEVEINPLDLAVEVSQT